MRRFFILFFFITASFLYSQTETIVTITPDKPKAGSIVNITYKPDKDSPLLKADTVLFQGNFFKPDTKSVLEEFVMEKTNEGFTIKLDLTGKDYTCIVFQFADKTGDPVDGNNDKCWDFMIYDRNNEPVKFAYYNLANSFRSRYPMKRETDVKTMVRLFEEEYKRFPSDLDVNYSLLFYKNSLQLDYEPQAKFLKSQLDPLLETDPENSKISLYGYYLYTITKDQERLSKLTELSRKKDKTNGLNGRRNKIFVMADTQEKLDTMLVLYKLAKGTRDESTLTQDIIMTASRVVDIDKFDELTKDLKNPDKETMVFKFGQYIIQYAEKLLTAKDRNSKEQNKLLTLIEKSEERLLNEMEAYSPEYARESFKSFPSRERYARKRTLGIGFNYLGQAEYAKGKYEQAISYFEKAEKLMPADEFFYSTNITPYVKALVESTIKHNSDTKPMFAVTKKLNLENNRIQKAIDYSIKALNNHYGDDLAKLLLQINSKLSKKSESLSKQIVKIKEKQTEERVKEVREKYKKDFVDAPDFDITDLKGKSLRISDLKGKIIILDFWATTCGWCLQSFKYLEKFYAKHKNDNDVFFGAVNLEVETGNNTKEKEKAVNVFLKKNKYDLPFYIDFGNKSGPLYNISGIPTLIIIGPDGKVYFREDGFGGTTLAEDVESVVERIRKEKI